MEDSADTQFVRHPCSFVSRKPPRTHQVEGEKILFCKGPNSWDSLALCEPLCGIYHTSYFTAFQNCMKYSDPGARIWSCTILWQLQSWAKYCMLYHGPWPPGHHAENTSRKRLFLAAMAAEPAGVRCPFLTCSYSPSAVLSPWGSQIFVQKPARMHSKNSGYASGNFGVLDYSFKWRNKFLKFPLKFPDSVLEALALGSVRPLSGVLFGPRLMQC